MKVGDRVSYQCAGMSQPEYGTVTGIPRIPSGLFVTFDGDKRGKFTDRAWLRAGEVPSWWQQDKDGKWHSTR